MVFHHVSLYCNPEISPGLFIVRLVEGQISGTDKKPLSFLDTVADITRKKLSLSVQAEM